MKILIFLFLTVGLALSDVIVQVNFVDTSVPNEVNNLKVCEAVHNALDLNISECLGRTPIRKSYEFILNVEDVLLEGVTASSIDIDAAVQNETDSYLREAGFFILPTGKVSLMLIPRELKYAAYVAISIFMFFMALILLLFLQKAKRKKSSRVSTTT